jgi:hypothetical protein
VSDAVPVFVNGHTVRIEAGEPVSSAVAMHDPALAEKLAAGSAYVTDGRGIRLPADSPLQGGAILRVVVSARRDADGADADA